MPIHRFKYDVVDIFETDYGVTANIKLEYKLASFEASRFEITKDNEELIELIELGLLEANNYPWYYVNRVIVPNGFKLQNASIFLMKAMSLWADTRQVNMLEENSPYRRLDGTVLTLQQLNRFDSLFGYKLIKEPNLMVRFPKPLLESKEMLE